MYVVISQPSRGTSMSVTVGEGQGRLGGVADDWRELRTHILTPSHTTTRGCRTPPLLRLHTVGQTRGPHHPESVSSPPREMESVHLRTQLVQ
jgi:hypothetical protein